ALNDFYGKEVIKAEDMPAPITRLIAQFLIAKEYMEPPTDQDPQALEEHERLVKEHIERIIGIHDLSETPPET
ncbi:MAG: hypothetical protein R3257_07105, partial [bacterium]|nr:hypothetical protein [bacterium]